MSILCLSKGTPHECLVNQPLKLKLSTALLAVNKVRIYDNILSDLNFLLKLNCINLKYA